VNNNKLFNFLKFDGKDPIEPGVKIIGPNCCP
jgi:hypothetical protein